MPSAVIVAGRKSGEAAAVPPRTIVANRRPGAARAGRFCDEEQMRHPEPEDERAEQPGGDEDRPAAGVAELGLGDDAERSAPANTKKKAAYRPWSAAEPTFTRQARA